MIGVVIVTHGRLAHEFRAALEHVVGPQEQIETISIGPDDDLDLRRSDMLTALARVDTGDGAPVQVVCGAPNARAGLVGVFGAPGTYVPGSDITLKVAAIRGVESRGMMCSMRELELSDEHAGIIELADGCPARAIGHLEESVAIWRTRGWHSMQATALTNLGKAYAQTEPLAARRAFEEAGAIFARLGNTAKLAELLPLIRPPGAE